MPRAAARDWRSVLLEGAVEPRLGAVAGRILGQMHQATPAADAALAPFRDKTVFEQFASNRFIVASRRRCPDVAPVLKLLIQDVTEKAICLCHGDYSPKNLLLDGDRFGSFAGASGFNDSSVLKPEAQAKEPFESIAGDSGFNDSSELKTEVPAKEPFTLVDYETAHMGDPAFDLGFFLSHLFLKALVHPERWHEFRDCSKSFGPATARVSTSRRSRRS